MSVYRPDVQGVTTRRAGEPCDHRHRVTYTDEGGPYSRCAVCGTQISPKPAENDAQRLVDVGSDRPATPARRGRNDCPCGAAYRAFFGQWWRTQWGSKWFCSPECAERHAGPTSH